MEEYEGIKKIGNQAAIQAVTSNDGARRYRCWTLTSHYSHPGRDTETEAWCNSPRKAVIELECPGLVYLVTEL